MFVRDVAANGDNVLFVGTKKQAGESIKEEAERAGAHYVNARWLGGMMTNFKTIRRRIQRLEQLRKMQEDGTFDRLPKKEVGKLELEIEKLEKIPRRYQNYGQAARAHCSSLTQEKKESQLLKLRNWAFRWLLSLTQTVIQTKSTM